MSQELAIIEHEAVELAGAGGQQGLENNPAAVYLASLRPTGRRSMLHHLNVIAGLASAGRHDAFSMPWHELRYQHTAALRTDLADKYKAATANQCLKALRRVLQEAWRLGLMEAEEYRRAADLKPIKAETLPKGRALSGGELAALLHACGSDQSPAGARDAALIAVLYAGGLRRSEVVKLNLVDYDSETGAVKVLNGKGGKDRLVYLEAGAAAALDDWLTARGQELGPLFNPINKGGRVAFGRMTDQAIFGLLTKRGQEAGLQHFSPHDLRRTFISDLLDAGADIATVQKLAGHANIQTTARYDRRGEAAKRKAASLLHLPYQRRRLAV